MLTVKEIREKYDIEQWYAIYKGDKFRFVGTKRECAKYLGVSENTIKFYTTPAYKRRREKGNYESRTIVIKVGDI